MKSSFVPGQFRERLALSIALVDWKNRNITGNVSYDPDNHQLMVKIRQEKVDKIAQYIPEQTIDNGPEKGKLLILGWGSTYGAIKSALWNYWLKDIQLHMRTFAICDLSRGTLDRLLITMSTCWFPKSIMVS
jgi:hypothetical protein